MHFISAVEMGEEVVKGENETFFREYRFGSKNDRD